MSMEKTTNKLFLVNKIDVSQFCTAVVSTIDAYNPLKQEALPTCVPRLVTSTVRPVQPMFEQL